MSNDEKWVPVNLPSKCLTYGLKDKSEVLIRPLKGRDEKLISEISNINSEKKFLILLKSIIKGVEVEKLTLGDRLFIVIWEIINSYSQTTTLKHECEYCWESSDFKVDFNTLEIVELPDDFKEPYEITLPDTGKLIKLKLLTVADNIKIDEMEKNKQNVWLYRYALSIVDEGSVFDKVAYLEDLPTVDLATIRAFQEKYNHGPKLEVKYVCPKCGGTGVMPIPFRIDFLFPYGQELIRNFGNTI